MTSLLACLVVGFRTVSSNWQSNKSGVVAIAHLNSSEADVTAVTTVKFIAKKHGETKETCFELDDCYPEPHLVKLFAPEHSGAFHLLIVGGYGSSDPISVFRIQDGKLAGKLVDESTKGRVTVRKTRGRLYFIDTWQAAVLFRFQGKVPTKLERDVTAFERRFFYDDSAKKYRVTWRTLKNGTRGGL